MDASLKQRVLTALIGLPLLLAVLFCPTPVIVAVVMAAALVGMKEYYNAIGIGGKKSLCRLGYLATIIIPLGIYFLTDTALVLVYLYIVVLFLMMLMSKNQITFQDIAYLVMGLIYIPYFLSHIIYIRDMELGNIYIWLVFVGAFLTDSCAYFAGCAIGGRKLCPSISPKKTVAGAVGGVVGCGLSFILFGIVMNHVFAGSLGGETLSFAKLFVLGLMVSVISQIGDLVASMLKRQCGIKDFGNLLPGHGGILDRCDSIILVAPVIFLFLLKIGILA